MASAKRCGFLLGALLAVGAIGVAGFSSGDLVFLKSSATEPFELQLVVRVRRAYTKTGCMTPALVWSCTLPLDWLLGACTAVLLKNTEGRNMPYTPYWS